MEFSFCTPPVFSDDKNAPHKVPIAAPRAPSEGRDSPRMISVRLV